MFRSIKNIYLGMLSLLIGMRVTIKNFFAPAVTLEYPIKKQPMKANFRGMVDLKPPDCVICYQCIKICPTAALYLSHKQTIEGEKKNKEITKFTFNAELCCFCGLCDEICPTDAIFMNKMYEVSAFEHEQLVSIDLMDPNKYTHLDKGYSLEAEVKDNDTRTIGIPPRPAPAPAAAPAGAGATAPAGTANTAVKTPAASGPATPAPAGGAAPSQPASSAPPAPPVTPKTENPST